MTNRERVRVGICSWTDTALLEDGWFYPRRSMTAEARLRYYARFFDTVEVNSAYYAMPEPRYARLWAERTPPGFLFNVKAYALLTGHHPRAESLPADLAAALPSRVTRTPRGEIEHSNFPPDAVDAAFRLFRASIEPLVTAGKLGYLLFQMAPWVHFDDRWMEYVRALPTRLPGLPVVVEMRHRSWFPDHADDTLAALRSAGVGHVIVDGPVMAGCVPRVTATTAAIAVFRLHGRHVEGWLKQLRGEGPSVREKYDYRYSEDELRDLVPEIEAVSDDVEQVFVSFNNNNRSYPVQNALMMKRLLGHRVVEPPAVGGGTAGLFGAMENR